MNFAKSKIILDEINKSNKILLALHHSVDPDSITSNLLMLGFLKKIGKDVQIIYTESLPKQFKDTYELSGVSENVDMMSFDLSKFDLLICLDVNDPERIGLNGNDISKIRSINIDHHSGMDYFEPFKVNDTSYSSTAEMIFYLLEDFGYKIDKHEADLVLLGIMTDTDSFAYGASPKVFQTVSRLLELGADYDRVNAIMYRSNSLDQIKFWAMGLEKLVVDEKFKFAYIFLKKEEVAKFKDVLQGTRTLADKFSRTLKDTNFGMVMTETNEGNLKISIRSRLSGFGVLPLVKSLGGGGHFDGGGAQIDGLAVEVAVNKVLEVARDFANSRL